MKNPHPKISEDKVLPFNYPLLSKSFLKRPEKKEDCNFFELSLKRRSERNFELLLPGQLDYLLWYSAKAIKTHMQADGYVLSYRPSPSAGARHPIDILVCESCSPPILSYYNPFDHSLNLLDIKPNDTKDLLNHINQNIPLLKGTFLWLVAHSIRTTSKYEYAESLIWRDAGALLQQLQLTAIALNLTSCPVGTLAEPFANRLFGHLGSVISTGGIIVGNGTH